MGNWGATQDDWDHLDLILGLTADLLPVVSRPGAVISPDSSMTAIGKTPSLYNRRGEVKGILGWADQVTTGKQIIAWAKQGDYGCCIQTRRVRAFDIDVPDLTAATAIANMVEAFAGPMALRWRSNSGKRLLAFEVEGGSGPKRTLQVEGGVIECLGIGQQFVGIGEHFNRDGTPSGARYAWRGGLPDGFLKLSAHEFEMVCAMLRERFGLSDWVISRDRVTGGEDLDVGDDEVAAWLPTHWPTYGVQGGKLYAECPWKAEHTGDSGETEAAWMIAGSGGVEQGHFKCLHAHCAGRLDVEFLDAVGYRLDGFDVVGEAPRAPLKNGHDPEGLPVIQPNFERKMKKGTDVPEATIGNVTMAARRSDLLGYHVAFDTFRAEMMMAPHGTGEWRPLDDDDLTTFRIDLPERLGFYPISKDMMRDAIGKVGKINQFDTAQVWIESLPPWDGVERAPRFMTDYMGCADTDYAKAVGLYMWTGHAGRVMHPGCKADMSPILVGDQGIGKTRGVIAISPSEDFFCEIGFHDKDDDFSRKLRGTLVVEIAELRGLNSKDAQTIKALMSRQFEKWTPKFKEYRTQFPRRLMFWGTSNEDEILADATGERRWLPIRVERDVDVEAIECDREQLWAEGLARWRKSGVAWRDAERLARNEHAKFKISDPWSYAVEKWLDEENVACVSNKNGDGFRSEVVALEALRIDLGRYGRPEEMRIGRILRGFGMTPVYKRVDGRVTRVWVLKK